MVTGRRPPIGPPRLDQIPADFRSFVERCCDDDPDQRYRDAADALAAFEALIPGADPTPDVSSTTLEELLSDWQSVGPDDDRGRAEVARRIIAYLLANADEEELYYNALPRLPRPLIWQLIYRHLSEFREVLQHYDRHIDGALPFSYCDVVADFYADVFRRAEDPEIRGLIVRRLVYLGPSHNRWRVGEVLARLLPLIHNWRTAELAAEALRANPEHGDWLQPYIGGFDSLLGPLQQAINEINARAQQPYGLASPPPQPF